MSALNALLQVLMACVLQQYHLACANSSDERRPVTIDAAFARPDTIILFAEGELAPVSLDYHRSMGTANYSNSWFRAVEEKVGKFQACFASFSGDRIFFYGPTRSCRVNATTLETDCFNYRRGRRRFLAGGGPDAAAKKGDKRYVFKGCQYVIRRNIFRWSKPRDIRDLGLPCHLDAAWTNGTSLVALRGNQLWVWKEDESVEGPIPFESAIHVEEWLVKPYTESDE